MSNIPSNDNRKQLINEEEFHRRQTRRRRETARKKRQKKSVLRRKCRRGFGTDRRHYTAMQKLFIGQACRDVRQYIRQQDHRQLYALGQFLLLYLQVGRMRVLAADGRQPIQFYLLADK